MKTFLLAFFLLGCVQQSATAQISKLFRDASDGVAFNYPQAWEKKPQRTTQFRIIVGDKDTVGDNCMLSTKTSAQLVQYSDEDAIRGTSARDIENGAAASGTRLKIISFERTKVGNRPAIYYEARSEYQSLGFKVDLVVAAVIVKVGDRLYELGCSVASPVYETQKNLFSSVLGSLTIR